MNQKIMERLRKCQIYILDEFDKLCKKHGLRYYLMYGTLIGAVRHKGYIPWDDDIDVGMPVEDYKKFLKIGKNELPDSLFLQTDQTDCYHARFFAKIRMNNTAFEPTESLQAKKHTGIFIDIIPLYKRDKKHNMLQKVRVKLGDIMNEVLIGKREKNKLCRKIYAPVYIMPSGFIAKLRNWLWDTKGALYYGFGYYHPKEAFEPSVELEFENKRYPAPKEYDDILHTIYGEYMQLPPPEKQVTHNPVRISFDLSGPDEVLD